MSGSEAEGEAVEDRPAPPLAMPSPRIRAQVKSFLALVGRPGMTAAFVGLALLSSVLEAVVLLLVVAGASSVLTDESAVMSVGPFELATDTDLLLSSAVLGTLVLVGARLAGGRIASRLAADLLHEVRTRLIRDVLRAPWAQQSLLPPARLQDLVSSQALQMAGLLGKLSTFATALIAFLAMVLALFLVDPTTAAVLVTVGGALGFAFRPLTARVRRAGRQHLHETHRYIATVSDLYGVLPEVRVYGVTGEADELHAASSARVAQAFRRMRNAAILQPSLYLGAVLLLLVGGIAALELRGGVSVAQAGAIVLVLMRGLRYSQGAQSGWQHVVESLPVVEDLDRIRAQLVTDVAPRGTRRLERVGSIVLESVSYTYPTGEPALRSVDLRIEPGRITGLAGPSGAGKTTLAHIVLGLRHPTAGRVLINGIPSLEFDEASWFERFAYVSQHPLLLDADVSENVRFMRSALSDHDLSSALSRASMDSDLAVWAAGERRRVGTSGSQVSGGQRQRIAIARALAGRPEVLVLDEPTSALDPEAELTIRDTLEALHGQLTVVLIAHRESTLDACDIVVRMENGTVAAVEDRTARA